MTRIPDSWQQALEQYPADPVFPDGKPLSIRVQELMDQGIDPSDAQDIAEGEIHKFSMA